MWVRNGEVYDGVLIENGWKTWGASEERLRAAWYEWIEEPPEVAEPADEPKRYSKLKLIRALGEAWREKRDELEAAGMLDEFMAAQYLATDDPVFGAIYDHLTDEEKRILDEECTYHE